MPISSDDSYLEILKLFKSNIMKSISVAEIGIVIKTYDDYADCKLLNDQSLIIKCFCSKFDNIKQNDLVVILFADSDFRNNLVRFNSNLIQSTKENSIFHSKNYGIIIRKLYALGQDGTLKDVRINDESIVEDGVANIIADTTVTEDSDNLITSGAVANSLDNYLQKDGDGSNTTVIFQEAQSVSDISSGDTQTTLWGKIKKWYTSKISQLKALAFKDKVEAGDYTAGSITSTDVDSTIAKTVDIPTVNNGTLTIQKNGTQVATFSANQGTNATANIAVPVNLADLNNRDFSNITNRYQSLVAWGGNSITGSVSPIETATIDDLGGNKFAFASANTVTAQYSRDGGVTWLDYGASDEDKRKLVTTSATFRIGNRSGANNTVNDQLRIILNANIAGGNVYCALKRLLLYISTNGSDGSKVKVERRLISNYLNNVDTWIDDGTTSISGWSGWNSIKLACSFGGSSDQTTQTAQIRLTFSVTSVSSTYGNLVVNKIQAIANPLWTSPSTMASTRHLYSYDINQNATFPASIILNNATPLKGTTTGGITLGLISMASDNSMIIGDSSFAAGAFIAVKRSIRPSTDIGSATGVDLGRSQTKFRDLFLSGKAYTPIINNGGDINVPATSGTMALTSDLPTSIDGMSGGSLTSPLVISGGDLTTASKIALSRAQSGQITDESTSTLFGWLSNNATTLTVGSNSYGLNLRGNTTRPQYKGSDLALYSDIPTVPTKTSDLTNDGNDGTSPFATENFVNSSIATNTAYFRGTYNIVTDLGLTTSATEQQIATALANQMTSQSITPTNNDYCFVSYPDATDPTQIDKYDRYKYNKSNSTWEYEYTLNNSSFTAAQWAAINSGVTSGNFVNSGNVDQTIAGVKTFTGSVVAKGNVVFKDSSDVQKAIIENSNGYITGTWLRTTNTTEADPKNVNQGIALINSGWIYYRSWLNFKKDLDYSNPNLLLNSNFSINNTGVKQWSGNDKAIIDKWYSYGATVTATSAGLSLSGNSASRIYQDIINIRDLWGQYVTLSASIDGVTYTYTGQLPTTIPTANTNILTSEYTNNYRLRLQYRPSPGIMRFIIDCNKTSSYTYVVNWGKIEIGNIATMNYSKIYEVENASILMNNFICTTSASVAAKTVSIPQYTLAQGNMVYVYFVEANSSDNPTLSINGTTGKQIYVDGALATSTNILTAGWHMFYYDGNYYQTGSNMFPAIVNAVTLTDTQTITGEKTFTTSGSGETNLNLNNSNNSQNRINFKLNGSTQTILRQASTNFVSQSNEWYFRPTNNVNTKAVIVDPTNGNIRPETTGNANLGSSSNKWNNLYLSGNLTDGTYACTVEDLYYTYVQRYGQNLLINSDFSINQRNELSYTATGADTYTVDRWIMTQGQGAVFNAKYNTDYITFAASSGSTSRLRQYIDDYSNFFGKTLTLSMETKTGNIISLTGTVTNTTGIHIGSSATWLNLTYDAENGKMYVQIRPNQTDGGIKWVKLEYGNKLTPYIYPIHYDELDKCLTYYQRISRDTGPFCFVYCPTYSKYFTGIISFTKRMRAQPRFNHSDLSYFDCKGQTPIDITITGSSLTNDNVSISIEVPNAAQTDLVGTLNSVYHVSYLTFDAEITP